MNRSIGSLGIESTTIVEEINILCPFTLVPSRETLQWNSKLHGRTCAHPTALSTPQVTNLEHNQDATSDLSHYTVSDCSLITKC